LFVILAAFGRVRTGCRCSGRRRLAGRDRGVLMIKHTIPIGNEHGRLRVVRDIDSPLAACKELAFSVEDGKERSWFTTDVCKQEKAWEWASAEPAVARWGFLQ
jgi:hypothetical protein